MGKKLNCWEFEKCGREPGGTNAEELGICPAATGIFVNGINGGVNGGRICWAIAGSLSNAMITGTFAKEKFSCMSCDFFKLVSNEERIEVYEILTPAQLNTFLVERLKEAQHLWKEEADKDSQSI
jgi:hypothetical protein